MKQFIYRAHLLFLLTIGCCLSISAQYFNGFPIGGSNGNPFTSNDSIYYELQAKILCEYAKISLEYGDFQSAAMLAQQAWDLIRDLTDPSFSVTRAKAANILSNVYSNMGDYKAAEEYAWKTIEIAKESTGGYLPNDVAAAISTLGMIYYNLGDYTKALKYYTQADSMLTEAIKAYKDAGEYEYFRPIFEQQQAIFTGNIGTAYYKMGKWSFAAHFCQKAADAFESLTNNGDNYSVAPLHATALANYGMALFYYNRDPRAEKFCQEALDISNKYLSPNHIFAANCLQNLGIIAEFHKDYQEALQYYQRALQIAKLNIDESHPYYCTLQNLLGNLYCAQGEYKLAKPILQKSFFSTKKTFSQASSYLIESQRALYWDKITKEGAGIYPILTYRAYHQDKESATFAYDNELFTKGLLLTSSNAVKNSVLESGDTTLIRQWGELTRKKQQIMALEEKNPQMPYLSELRGEAENLEKEVTRKSAAFRENMRQWAITWDSVRAALKPNQVAIEYMRAPLNEDSTMYCALLLRDTCSYPIMIPLFEEKEVSQLLHQSTTEEDSAAIRQTYTYKDHGGELTQLIWEKTMPFIREGEVVFFAPTGILHQIAIENLPYDTTYSMTEKYNLVRLSSTRELAMDRPAIEHKKATLYGDIRYSTTIEGMVVAAAKYRGTQRDYADDLPGTKKEIAAIDTILEKQQIQVQIFTSSKANEESVKALSGSKQNILHFATHGFYWQDSTGIDPMERCGLLFAGANNVLIGSPERLKDVDVNDGILTAKELSVLDFRNADIVVMSACETGLGEINGEGVFGLQRAFKMAGAKTIMMSLWQVSDDATRLLMTSFYRNLSQGMSKREAFRSAQQEVRNYTTDGASSESRGMSGKEKMLNKGKMGGGNQPSEVSRQKAEVSKPYASPYYWAGFILLD